MSTITLNFTSDDEGYWLHDLQETWDTFSWVTGGYLQLKTVIANNGNYYAYRNRAFRGNIDLQWTARFTHESSLYNEFYFGLCRSNSYLSNQMTIRCRWAGSSMKVGCALGGAEQDLTNFSTSKWYDFRVLQNSSTDVVTFYWRENGDATWILLYTTSSGYTHSTFLDSYGAMIVTRIYVYQSPYPQLLMEFDQITIIADEQEEDGSWPNEISCDFDGSGFCSFYSTSGYGTLDVSAIEAAARHTYEVDDVPFWSSIESGWKVKNHGDNKVMWLNSHEPEKTADERSLWSNTLGGSGIDIVFKVRINALEGGAYFEIYFWNSNNNYVKLSFRNNEYFLDPYKESSYIQFYRTLGSSGAGNIYLDNPSHIPHNQWNYFRFKANWTTGKIEGWLSVAGLGDWLYMGTVTCTDSAVNDSFWNLTTIEVRSHCISARDGYTDVEVDAIWNLGYTSLNYDRWCKVDSVFCAPRFLFFEQGNNYEFVYGEHWFNYEFTTQNQHWDPSTNVEEYDATYNPPYTLPHVWWNNQSPLQMDMLFNVKGNLCVIIESQYWYDSDSVGEFSGWTWTINDTTTIRLGHFYNDIAGIEIGGVLYQHTLNSYGSRPTRIEVRLIGNHFTCWIDQDLAFDAVGPELVYESTDFLGSPAEYDHNNWEFSRWSNGYFKWREFQFWGQILVPYPISAQLAGSWNVGGYVLGEYNFTDTAGFTEAYFFHKTGLTGGGADDLDGLDPNDLEGTGQTLKAGSLCMTITDTNETHVHVAVIDGTAVESIPDVILADVNPGSWAWKRIDAMSSAQLTKLNLTTVAQTIAQGSNDVYLPTFWNDALSGVLDDVVLRISPLGASSASKTGELSLVSVPLLILKDNDLT